MMAVRRYRVVVAILLVLALFSGPAGATVWETTYFTRAAGGSAPNWCVNGHYLLLQGPSSTTVYIHQTDWVFLGLYGQVTLPTDFPVINFPVGKDLATVVPIPCP
jgi:hypothetical protein